MPEKLVLQQYQALPLRAKILMSQQRIREWYYHFCGNVLISFSGGKDSTVLAHLVHEIYPNVPLVFSDTGLEFPELKNFAKLMGAVVVRPEITFSEVVSKYGYPIISKEVAEYIRYSRKIVNADGGITASLDVKPRTFYRRKAFTGDCGRGEYREQKKSMFHKIKWLPLLQNTQFKISEVCCDVIKKAPLKKYQHVTGAKPYVGSLTVESKARERAWIRHGCNSFVSFNQVSNPMSFWTEQDVLQYIYENKLSIASVYGNVVQTNKDNPCYRCTGYQRTGCIFCAFGAHLEKEKTRFQLLAETHPKLYEYCLGGGQWVSNPEYDPSAPKMDGDWKNWNPSQIWVPSKKGLGMKKVFDDCNQIYGAGFIKY